MRGFGKSDRPYGKYDFDVFSDDIKVVTETQPTEEQKKALLFSQRVVKYVKSNAIVVSNGIQAFGIGGGQVNRIWATQQAIERAKEKFSGDLVLASDAFFPFRDVVDFCAKEGIAAIGNQSNKSIIFAKARAGIDASS